jgi:hypothetical protein
MKAFDITIYGNISYDNIIENFQQYTSVGCMGNVWLQLKKSYPNLKVKLEPTDIGESLILIDKNQDKRTSVSLLSTNNKIPTIYDSKISHIMYLNELKSTDFIKNVKGTVVADVCNGKKLNLKDLNFKNIDILLISDEDCHYDIEDLKNATKGCVIIHDSSGSTLHKGKIKTRFNAEIVKNVNVLGAGDKFAAFLIGNMLEYSENLNNSIQEAHNKLSILFKNEKI